MLRNLRARRRPRYGTQVCALLAALLLLLSVSLLYSRLNVFFQRQPHPHPYQYDPVSLTNTLLDDPTDPDYKSTEDRIDELDDVILNAGSNDDDVPEEDDEESDRSSSRVPSTFFYDHLSGVVRWGFNKRSIDDWEDYVNFESKMKLGLGYESADRANAAFGSDDFPVDDKIRRKLSEVAKIEDVFLMKGSPLREGWGKWFEKKSDFLRRDRMFKSNLESLNPMNHPMLQDPDGIGVSGLTRGDKLVQKALMNEFKKVPFLLKKPLTISESEQSELVKPRNLEVKGSAMKRNEEIGAKIDDQKSQSNRARRRTLNDNDVNHAYISRVVDNNHGDLLDTSGAQNGNVQGVKMSKGEVSGQIYADGKKWGYYPGLHPRLSFSNFMNAFLRKENCRLRVFMVWNSPLWMFGVRQQRGLESLFYHHQDACVVVFSETIELNFFSGFVRDGFKVAVVMPNLDELLKDTPAHIFASVWYEWKKTKYYPTHYSELIRLAALYKYGGLYLDSDIIVLNPLSSLQDTVGMEDEEERYNLNGAVMAFRKHSPFVMKCLMEFYSSYDDTQLRWNGAGLLNRVASNFTNDQNASGVNFELNLQPSFAFFPISHNSISRYFTAPSTESERADQDVLYKKILENSITFHFWNSLTSAMVPEPDSLVARLINYHCIRCSDIL